MKKLGGSVDVVLAVIAALALFGVSHLLKPSCALGFKVDRSIVSKTIKRNLVGSLRNPISFSFWHFAQIDQRPLLRTFRSLSKSKAADLSFSFEEQLVDSIESRGYLAKENQEYNHGSLSLNRLKIARSSGSLQAFNGFGMSMKFPTQTVFLRFL